MNAKGDQILCCVFFAILPNLHDLHSLRPVPGSVNSAQLVVRLHGRHKVVISVCSAAKDFYWLIYAFDQTTKQLCSARSASGRKVKRNSFQGHSSTKSASFFSRYANLNSFIKQSLDSFQMSSKLERRGLKRTDSKRKAVLPSSLRKWL